MSLDIFLFCTRDGQPSSFMKSLAEEILIRDAVDKRLPVTDVEYPDGSRAEVYGLEEDEGDDIDNLYFSHCGGETFFAMLYELAVKTGSYIWWSDEPPNIAVTSEAKRADLPADMAADLGPPYVVSSGAELADAIYG
jgi:hypothetical protein